MKIITSFYIFLAFASTLAQQSEIWFESNGWNDSLVAKNPFKKFIGEWTLKNDDWTHNWGGNTKTIKIPNHHTISNQINTANSLISIVDGPRPNGHIYWSYNPVSKTVSHLSSFGELRAGMGEGKVDENGNVRLKITFEGEEKDTFRIYHYTWVNADEYHMKSVQYTSDKTPTGLFYEGYFIRLPQKETAIKEKIEAVLAVLDRTDIPVEAQLKVYTEDIVHMAPGNKLNIGKEALGDFLRTQREQGEILMKHEVVELERHGPLIVMQGQVKGTFYPKNPSNPVEFKTKNLFIFEQWDNTWKIKKVIYNSSPPDNE